MRNMVGERERGKDYGSSWLQHHSWSRELRILGLASGPSWNVFLVLELWCPLRGKELLLVLLKLGNTGVRGGWYIPGQKYCLEFLTPGCNLVLNLVILFRKTRVVLGVMAERIGV